MASGSVQRSARHHLFRRRHADAPPFSRAFYAITLWIACATLGEGGIVVARRLAIKLPAREPAPSQHLRGSPTVGERRRQLVVYLQETLDFAPNFNGPWLLPFRRLGMHLPLGVIGL